MEGPLGCSVRSLMRESGTFLFNSLRICEMGLLIPERRRMIWLGSEGSELKSETV
ncbi:hypothetical protein ACJIZ3_003134 [Penstemon smallii]|uniref:Uncharacterized protein n=1 Tax=Penstemon smallii TaxID=265156 RepID=A0ABD3UAC9_9LAMI